MKKLFLLSILLVIYSSFLFSQQFKFAWVTDTHVGSAGGAINLAKVVADINAKNFPFVIVSGDIAEKGRNSELEEAKQILDSLKSKYYIIPGNHDTKWSESGCTKFSELWGGNKFNFVYQGVRFIGLNSGVLLRGGGGHISSEDIVWLDSVLGKVKKDEPLVVITHHPLDGDIDNWFEVTNRIKNNNVVALLYGHGHVNRQSYIAGFPALMARSILNDKQGRWGYASIEFSKDSLFFFEEDGDTLTAKLGSVPLNEKRDIKKIDSLQFINYNANVLCQYDIKKTLSASLYVYEGHIYAAAYDGTVYCMNSEGKILWKTAINGNIVSKPVAKNNILVAGTVQGDIVSIDCQTGKIIQTLGVDDAVTSQLTATSIVADKDTINTFFVGTASGAMICFEFKTFQEVWRNTDAKGMIETEPLVVDDKIIYGSWDSYLYCIELSSGRIFWKYSGNNNFYFSPAACKPLTDGKNVFIETPDKYVTSVDMLLGKANWRKNETECWESGGISTDKKSLFIKSITNKFHIVSAKTGKIIKSIDCKFGTDTMPIEAIENSGNIFFSTKTGYVYIIDREYKLIPVLFLGTSRVHSVKQVDDNTFAASNMDGKIVVFKLNLNAQ